MGRGIISWVNPVECKQTTTSISIHVYNLLNCKFIERKNNVYKFDKITFETDNPPKTKLIKGQLYHIIADVIHNRIQITKQ